MTGHMNKTSYLLNSLKGLLSSKEDKTWWITEVARRHFDFNLCPKFIVRMIYCIVTGNYLSHIQFKPTEARLIYSCEYPCCWRYEPFPVWKYLSLWNCFPVIRLWLWSSRVNEALHIHTLHFKCMKHWTSCLTGQTYLKFISPLMPASFLTAHKYYVAILFEVLAIDLWCFF